MVCLDLFIKMVTVLGMVYGGYRWVNAWIARRRKKDLFVENYAACVEVESYQI